MTAILQDLYIGQGDNAPAPTWAMPFTPSGVWQLVVSTRTMTLTLRSDTGDLLVDLTANTVTWPISTAQSAMLPIGRLTSYTLRRIVAGGETRFYAGGFIIVLNGPVPGSTVQVVVAGPQGAPGPAQIISGNGPPADSDGANGQFWIDLGSQPAIYGPKASGAWPGIGYLLGAPIALVSQTDFSNPDNAVFANR
jgi:hypothetical protein